ncbi:MAG: hypothetical protein V2J26_12115 [Pacificimonas sp.]|jgi:hypothetical protein|nr:hypothetical protein [Pacificimonas sp.]
MTLKTRLAERVHASPGLTARELAQDLTGDESYANRVGALCRELIEQGKIERRGKGRAADPFRYY